MVWIEYQGVCGQADGGGVFVGERAFVYFEEAAPQPQLQSASLYKMRYIPAFHRKGIPHLHHM